MYFSEEQRILQHTGLYITLMSNVSITNIPMSYLGNTWYITLLLKKIHVFYNINLKNCTLHSIIKHEQHRCLS